MNKFEPHYLHLERHKNKKTKAGKFITLSYDQKSDDTIFSINFLELISKTKNESNKKRTYIHRFQCIAALLDVSSFILPSICFSFLLLFSCCACHHFVFFGRVVAFTFDGRIALC